LRPDVSCFTLAFQHETTVLLLKMDLGKIGTQVLEMSGNDGPANAGTVLAMKYTTSSP
jgi:hypothetical protein